MSLFFLTLEELLAIHSNQIEKYGGRGGLLNIDLLKSAAAMPSSTFDGNFLHRDLAEMSAAYLYHIVVNHPFIDGNKRVGAVAAIVFFAMNDMDLNTPEEEFENLVLGVARGDMDKETAAHFFRKYLKAT